MEIKCKGLFGSYGNRIFIILAVIRLIRFNTNKTRKKDKTKTICYFLPFFFCLFCIKFVMTQGRIKLLRNNIDAIMVSSVSD